MLNRKIKNILAFLMVASGSVAIAVTTFLIGEKLRNAKISKYEVPTLFLEIAKGGGEVNSVLYENENRLCVIGGYGSVDDLPMLNTNQKKSLTDEGLPRESLSWYILAFNDESLTRAYLVDLSILEADVDGVGAGCSDRTGKFTVVKKDEINGVSKRVLKIRTR